MSASRWANEERRSAACSMASSRFAISSPSWARCTTNSAHAPKTSNDWRDASSSSAITSSTATPCGRAADGTYLCRVRCKHQTPPSSHPREAAPTPQRRGPAEPCSVVRSTCLGGLLRGGCFSHLPLVPPLPPSGERSAGHDPRPRPARPGPRCRRTTAVRRLAVGRGGRRSPATPGRCPSPGARASWLRVISMRVPISSSRPSTPSELKFRLVEGLGEPRCARQEVLRLRDLGVAPTVLE